MKRLFTEYFSVGDIAEPLVSFDATSSATEVRQVMEEQAYQVVGLRKDGVTIGYVKQEDLSDGACGDYLCGFDDTEVVSEALCFPRLVELLSHLPRLFVTSFGRVGGIVTRSDLQKPPVRMWLFGMITILEMGLTRLVEMRFPNGKWRDCLSESRLRKAEALLEERKRRNQELDLIDCLQFSDKGQITLKDESLREQVGYASRRRGEDAIKRLEALRNSLAHSQNIVSCDWETIVQLTKNLDKILSVHESGQTGTR